MQGRSMATTVDSNVTIPNTEIWSDRSAYSALGGVAMAVDSQVTTESAPFNITISDPEEIWGLSIETFAYVFLAIGGAAPVIFLIIVMIALKCHNRKKARERRASAIVAGINNYGFTRGTGADGARHHGAYGNGHTRTLPAHKNGGGYGMPNGSAGVPRHSEYHQQYGASVKYNGSIRSTDANTYGINSYGEPAYGDGYRMSSNNPNVYYGTINQPSNRSRTQINHVARSDGGGGGGGGAVSYDPGHQPSTGNHALRHSASINSEERHALSYFDSIYEGMDSSGGSVSDLVYANGGIHAMPGAPPPQTSPQHAYANVHKQAPPKHNVGHDAALQTNTIELYSMPKVSQDHTVTGAPRSATIATQTSVSDMDSPAWPAPPSPITELSPSDSVYPVTTPAQQQTAPSSIEQSDAPNRNIKPSASASDASSHGNGTQGGDSGDYADSVVSSDQGSYTLTNNGLYNTIATDVPTMHTTAHVHHLSTDEVIVHQHNTDKPPALDSSASLQDISLQDMTLQSVGTSATNLSTDSRVDLDVAVPVGGVRVLEHPPPARSARTASPSVSTQPAAHNKPDGHRHQPDMRGSIDLTDERVLIMAGIRPPSPNSTDNIAYEED